MKEYQFGDVVEEKPLSKKIKKLREKITKKKLFSSLSLIVIVLMLPAFIFVVQQRQETRQQAAESYPQTTYLRQTLYSLDGQTAWFRDCPVTNTGPNLSQCNEWSEGQSLTNLRGSGTTETYGSYGAFMYTDAAGVTQIRQVVYNTAGNTAWSRDCPFSTVGGIGFARCTGWTEASLSGLPGGTTYTGFTGFLYQSNGQTRIRRAIYSTNGTEGWYLDCAMGGSGIPPGNDPSCGSGWQRVPLDNLRGVGNEKYGELSTVVYNDASGQITRQVLITLDGTAGFARTCPTPVPADQSGCSAWQDIGLANIRGAGNEAYGAYEEFTYALTTQPNIAVFMMDDLDKGLLDALIANNNMPHLQNRIIAKGTQFSNSFVSNSVCCPSRATFFTGQYSHNHKTYTNDLSTGGGFLSFKDNESATVAMWLHNNGYKTSLIGKYLNYYGADGDKAYVPAGWDNWQGLLDWKTYRMYGYDINNNGVYEQYEQYGTNPAYYQTDVLSQKARAFLTSTQNPFFLYLAPAVPHIETDGDFLTDYVDYAGAWKVSIKPAARHLTIPVPDFVQTASFNEDVSDKPAWLKAHPPMTAEDQAGNAKQYKDRGRAMLAVDDMVRDVTNTLRLSGQINNTYLIFTSDNGYLHGQHRLSNKMYAYEEAIRVPLYIAGPGVPRQTIDKIVLNNDLAPTLVAITKSSATHQFDGRSLLPLITNPNIAWRNKFLIEHWADRYDKDGKILWYDLPTYTAIRTGATNIAPESTYIVYKNSIEREYYNEPNQTTSKIKTSAETSYESGMLESWIAQLATCAGSTCQALEDANPFAPTSVPIPTRIPTPTSVPTPTSTVSTLTIYAEGTPAEGVYPNMKLAINGVTVKEFLNVTTGVKAYPYVHIGLLSPAQVKIGFTNDYDAPGPEDRNLRVDRITINGVTYHSESPYTQNDGCYPGTDVLYCTSSFTYSAQSTILPSPTPTPTAAYKVELLNPAPAKRVDDGFARGEQYEFKWKLTGLNSTALSQPALQTVITLINATTLERTTLVSAPGTSKIGENLYRATIPSTFKPGEYKVELLVKNASNVPVATATTTYTLPAGPRITVRASGTAVDAVYPLIRLTIQDGDVERTLKQVYVDAITTNTDISFVVPAIYSVNQFRIRYINEYAAPGRGDRNLTVTELAIGTAKYAPSASNVYSVGSYTSTTGCAGGFKQSNTLHCNGYFHFDQDSPPVVTVKPPLFPEGTVSINTTSFTGTFLRSATSTMYSASPLTITSQGATQWKIENAVNAIPFTGVGFSSLQSNIATGQTQSVSPTIQGTNTAGIYRSVYSFSYFKNNIWTKGPSLVTLFTLKQPSSADTDPTKSVIRIYAAGTHTDGRYPTMQLQINDQIVRTDTVTGVFVSADGKATVNKLYREYAYVSPTRLPKDTRIRIHFTNDENLGVNKDKLLIIALVTIDGRSYSMAAPTVLSKGSYTPDNGCGEGYKKRNVLDCTGYFEFKTL